ncbi:hypothetical protein [Amycolatopsis sp. DSM 110486]|uniref:hypothetical protein n=1 Tax=Amycolatopsis sp. DSM 110486 TaxID=2865832 RepID=UPI001C6954D6|nr:hypothetical protein [Amycolatopsis sp. DSM 110486]QYN17591.1 hypothetical protein K1T34_32925 [Amycolatopsis sp. DSM 110486]
MARYPTPTTSRETGHHETVNRDELERVVNAVKTQLAVEKAAVTSVVNDISAKIIDTLRDNETIRKAVTDAVDSVTESIVTELATSDVIVKALKEAAAEAKADKLAAVDHVSELLEDMLPSGAGDVQPRPDLPQSVTPRHEPIPIPLPAPIEDDGGAGEGESLGEVVPENEPASVRRMMRALTGNRNN